MGAGQARGLRKYATNAGITSAANDSPNIEAALCYANSYIAVPQILHKDSYHYFDVSSPSAKVYGLFP
jgi:hypothetical protein